MEYKLCLLLLAVACTEYSTGYNHVPEEFKEIAPKMRQACQEKSGANLDLIDQMMTGNFDVGKPEACYLKCLLDTLDVWTPDGHIDYEKLTDGFSEMMKPIVKPVFDACQHIYAGEECETSRLAHKCYYDSDSSNFFVI